MKSASFKLDGLDDQIFPGYTDGRHWNGWACPRFAFEVAQSIVSYSRLLQTAFYDEEVDEFVFGDEDEERFGAVEVEGKRLYQIGAGSWIWEEADER